MDTNKTLNQIDEMRHSLAQCDDLIRKGIKPIATLYVIAGQCEKLIHNLERKNE